MRGDFIQKTDDRAGIIFYADVDGRDEFFAFAHEIIVKADYGDIFGNPISFLFQLIFQIVRDGIVVTDKGGRHFGGEFKIDVLPVFRAVADIPFVAYFLFIFKHAFIIPHGSVENIVCLYGMEEQKFLLYDDFGCWDEGVYIGQVSKETIAKMPKEN